MSRYLKIFQFAEFHSTFNEAQQRPLPANNKSQSIRKELFFKLYHMFQKHLVMREVQLILLMILFNFLATQMITYGSSPPFKCPNVRWEGDRWKTGAIWAPNPDLLAVASVLVSDTLSDHELRVSPGTNLSHQRP